MSRITLITLDLDNTLWDVDRIILRAEREMLDWLRSNAPTSLEHYHPEHLPDIRSTVSQRHGDKLHDLTFMRIEVLAEVMQRAGYDPGTSRELANRAFEVFFAGRNRVEFFPGALQMLRGLSGRYKIIALTNGNADITRAGLADYLSGAVSAADIGKSKPSAEMFLAPLESLNVRPEQAIHIGDNLIDDIQGANAVGMHSIWTNLRGEDRCPDDPMPSREVRTLEDVAAAVASLQLP